MQAKALIGDKAFDASRRVIEPLMGAGKTIVIPPKSGRRTPRTYDRDLYKARHLINIDQAWRLSRIKGGFVSTTGGGKRRQGSGVARIVFELAIVAASASTNLAEPPPALTERLLRQAQAAPRYRNA